jgi:hypothetical protein
MVRQVFDSWHVRMARLAAVVAAVVALCAFGIAAVAAGAEAPRWAVTAVPSPTNLPPESPRSEVDRLTVEATGGTYSIEILIGNQTYSTSQLAYNAEAAVVEATMNETLNKGTGTNTSVKVTEGPGGTTPYTITWGGETENKSLEFEHIKTVRAQSKNLAGGAHTATITRVVEGVTAAILTVQATNVGSGATDGSTITLSDVLPAGVTATAIAGSGAYKDFENFFGLVECSSPPAIVCKYNGALDPGDSVILRITLSVGSGLPSTVGNEVKIGGGGIGSAEVETPLTVSATPAPFGVVPGSVVAALSNMQAGAH